MVLEGVPKVLESAEGVKPYLEEVLGSLQGLSNFVMEFM